MFCRHYCMEFIGTFFLVLSIALTGNPLAFGLIFTALVYIGGHISGAHYNPAVTLAVTLDSPMSLKATIGYCISQIAAGFAASAVYYVLAGTTFSPDPGAGVIAWKAFIIEILFTYLFVLAIFTATRVHSLKGHLYGLIIGLTLTGIAFMGGVYNPAVAVGPMVVDSLVSGGPFINVFMYVIGSICGALLAAWSFRWFNKE